MSNLFTGQESRAKSPEPEENFSSTSVSQLAPGASPINRFAGSWLGELPVVFPKNYLLGIDTQQKDFEQGRKSYLRGEWRDRGWWYYYLYAVAIKVPLGLWALGAFCLIWRFYHVSHRPVGEKPGEGSESVQLTAVSQQLTASLRDEFILLFPAILIFAIVSSKTGFSEHMRYVLPAFPYFFIAISQIAQVFSEKRSRTHESA